MKQKQSNKDKHGMCNTLCSLAVYVENFDFKSGASRKK